ncbi:MAG: stage V sporulation protein AD [Eubacteriales bacterium]|nr:stage V sporulation protein AD [Eubacteriales bacterium]MDD4582619.1 stage V sporulation protein AD [Eubacteriales bacterium]
MIKNMVGKQTLCFRNQPEILGTGSVVGVKEGKGPLGECFDVVLEEDIYGEKTWEKAETKMLKEAILLSIKKAGKTKEQINAILSGDLLNQLMSASFSARDLQIPFLGLYGACSTMTESMIVGAVLVDGGYADHVVAAASSHYCTAERQFRMPLEHGNQRPPSAHWTVTGSGSVVIGKTDHPYICCTYGTIGKIVDPGITDTNQMGAAMAPAALDTVITHFSDTGRPLDYYDMILTGDLGHIGKDILLDMMKKQGMDLEKVYNDCGVLIYDREQDTHSGGSGCGCSAVTFSGYIFDKLIKGQLKKILLISTGALMTTTSSQQGNSIPGIAHAIAVEIC